MFKQMKLGTKLMLAFLAVGIIPFAIVGTVALNKSGKALTELAYGQLEGMRGVKKAQIENYFDERKGDMAVLIETAATLRREAFQKLEAIQEIKKAQLTEYFQTMQSQLRNLKDDPYTGNALQELNRAFEAGGNRVDNSQWQTAVRKFDHRFKDLMKDNEWYDIFLINTEGSIVYTVAKEPDLGMNIAKSELAEQGIGKAFQQARSMGVEDIAIADLAPYSPSGGVPAGFMMARVHDDAGNLRGFTALQIPLERINAIMLRRSGMGKTGESYLVGQDGMMRSDSFLDPKGHSVSASFKNKAKVDTEAVREALAGKENQKVIVDYNGNPVLSCWDPVELGSGIRWAMMSEIDVAEAFSPVNAKGEEFYAKYIQMYGYYDLFLINPDGYCFYTVAKESDYQTNLVNGKYADSGLGRLVRQVMKTNEFGLADFAPYAPSNGDPAAFIAQPVINDGRTELVVALQLSLKAINHIMKQRDGMGKTGETYLVGQDKLMRSDSFLDPDHHTVKASFADPNRGKVDTEAARNALSGQSGEKIIIDYNGNPVLSAYTPVKLGDTTWALLAEIDEAEAFAAVKTMRMLMAVVAFVGIGAIIAVAFLITRSISKPITRIIQGMTEGAEQVAAAANQVSSASQQGAEGASEQAASIEETSSSLEEMASMTKQNADNANQANQLMKESKKVVDQANTHMKSLTQSMAQISTASQETSKIIKTIDEIAFQTNLLALNAAVEAARAGEAGAGFAVVADEVRNLALRAAEAAKNTAQLIETTVKQIGDGAELVDRTDKAFEGVSASTSKVSELVAEIAAASSEQAQGIEQVNTAVAQMDKVTQQNAANSEESASASEEMSAQAMQLNQLVVDLAVLIGGNSAGGQSGSATSPDHGRPITPVDSKKKSSLPKSRQTVSAKKLIPLDQDDFADF